MTTTCSTFRRFQRRDFLRIGGASLCGVSLLDLLRARSRAAGMPEPKAKHMIVVWLAGGPPHTDMFDMKPDAPSEYRGEFKPIPSNLPGLDVCELLPKLSQCADKYTIIRSITTLNKPGDHSRAPMYWLTGNPRLPSGTPEFPMYGSVVSKFRPGPNELPSFAVLGRIDHHINNSIAGSFLGPAFNPFIFDPLQSKDDIAKMLSPQMELPAFARHTELLKSLDDRLRRQDGVDPLIAGLDRYQQTAFDMLRSPKLRQALDLSKESEQTLARYKHGHLDKYRYPSGDPLHFLMARRLIEAGVPVVHFSLGYWDWHGQNFVAARQQFPMLDSALSTLLDELDERGLLDETIVLCLGEMGRKPKVDGNNKDAGRDHWDYAQFVLAAGGGFKRGTIVGATDKLGEQVADKFYKVESFGRTLYELLGIDPETTVRTLNDRPIRLIGEDVPVVREALA